MKYKVLIYIEGKRVDTFDNETINIESSVQNIKDIGKVFNEFSQSFTVPASANNNRTFRHYYNADLEGGFDARVRHKAFIWVESLQIRLGTIRMDGVKMTRKKPEYYKLSFIGNLADLKDAFGDDFLSSLDYSGYNFTYSSDNIRDGLTTGLFGGDLKIPLISTDKQFFYNSNVNEITNQDRLVNIAWNGSATVHGVNWTSLRPAISTMKIIELIEAKYGLTFSRDFLGNTQTTELMLWLANKDTSENLQNTVIVKDYDTVQTFQLDKGNFNNATGAYVVTDRGSGFIREWDIRCFSSDNRQYTLQAMNNDTVVAERTTSGDITDMNIDFPGGIEKGSQLYVRIIASAGKTIDSINFRVKELSSDTVCFVERTTDIVIGTVEATIKDFAPPIKVFDFVKSYFQLFNLTIVPNSDTDFEVKQLDNWYNEGQIYDVSKYVDIEEYFVDRPEIFKEIEFKFKDPKTILAEQFKEFNNVGYGDLQTKLKDANGKNLDGEDFELEVSFEQMVYERLNDLETLGETNIVYGLSLTKSLSDVVPEGHLLYLQQRDISANPIALVNDTSAKEQLSLNIFVPSHVNNTDKDFSTTFGSEINEHDGTTILNSLFLLYYKDYITDSFSSKRRLIPITIMLPLWLMVKLKLNDRLIIDGVRYIINNYTMDITTGKTQFSLLNDIYGSSSNDESVVEEEESGNTGDEIVIVPEEEQEEPAAEATSFDISTLSSPTGLGSCDLIIDDKKYWDGVEFTPTLGDTIYNEKQMTTKFDGDNDYYKITSDRSIRVSSQGVVVDLFICTDGGGGGNA